MNRLLGVRSFQAVLLYLLSTVFAGQAQAVASPPLILLVDGYADGVIYNTRRHQGGGTNVDDLTPILRSLGDVVIGTELVHTAWQRHDEVRRMHPELMVIHLSAFRGGRRDTAASLEMLTGLLKAVGPTGTRVIIYSRRTGLEADARLQQQLFAALGRKGRITDHLRFLEIKDWNGGRFPTPATAESLRTLARELLAAAVTGGEVSRDQ